MKLTYFQNRKNREILVEFRQLLESYNSHSKYSWQSDSVIEDDKAKELRVRINRRMGRISDAVTWANRATSVVYSPPPATGGYAGRIDVFENLFRLHKYDIPHDIVYDIVDKSIGYYDDTRIASIAQTISPFHWLGKLLTYVGNFPFRLIKQAGFSDENIRYGLAGKIIALIAQITFIGAAIVTILTYFDYSQNDLMSSILTWFE